MYWPPRRHNSLRYATALLAAVSLAVLPSGASAGDGSEETAETPLPPESSVESVGGRTVERLSLEELDAHALEHAPRIREAKRRLGFADARMEGAEIAFPANPTLESGLGNKFLGGYGLRKFEVGISQSFEIAGERKTRIRAAEQFDQRLETELEEARWEVHRRVHVLYYRTLLAQRRLRLAGEVESLAATLEEKTEQREQAGAVGRTEVEVAGAEAARAREAVVQARQRLESEALKLAEVIGWDAQTVPVADGSLPEVRRAPEVRRLVDRALEHEPTLAAIRARRELAEAEIEVAERGVWPNPKVGVAYEQERRLGPNREQTLWVRLALPLPLWRRNQREKAVARVEKRFQKTRLEERREVLRTRIRRGVTRLNRTVERVEIYGEDILPRFDDQLALLRKGYELGEMSILDVYNARDRLLETQRKALDALGAYLEARGELERSLGTEIWSTSEEK